MDVKTWLADKWESLFENIGVNFVKSIDGSKANHWLNAIILDSRQNRDEFLKITNNNNVMTRPIWTLMSKLPMFKDCQTDGLVNSHWLEDLVVNIPSSVPAGVLKKMEI